MFKPIPPRSERRRAAKQEYSFKRGGAARVSAAPAGKVSPVFSNLDHPEVRKAFSQDAREPAQKFTRAMAPEKPYRFFDRGFFIRMLIVPTCIFKFFKYISFRASAYQTAKAKRDLAKLAGVSLAVAVAIFGALSAWRPEAMLKFSLGNVFTLAFSFMVSLNILAEIRFERPNIRAWKIPKHKRDEFKRENGFGLDAKAQMDAIQKNGWRVDYLATNARLGIEEFPDDKPERSCIGADAGEWKWILFNSERFEKHFSIFGDEGFGLKNLLRVLVKAICGEPDCALVFVDGNKDSGFSFSTFENLPNASLSVGLIAALQAIQIVWEELRFRDSQYKFKGIKEFFRIGLVLDEGLAAAAYGFWKKSLATQETLTLRRELSAKLGEIIDNGKRLNIHCIAVMDNDLINHKIWQKMRNRFEAIALHFSREVAIIDSGFEVKQKTQTNDLPFLHVATWIWGLSNVPFKVPDLPPEKLFAYLAERAKKVSQPVKDFLTKIKSR